MPSGSYDRQRFASHNPAHPLTWVRLYVLSLEPLWSSKFLRLSEPAFGLPAASRVQQQRLRTPTPAQGGLWSENQTKPNPLLRSFAPPSSAEDSSRRYLSRSSASTSLRWRSSHVLRGMNPGTPV